MVGTVYSVLYSLGTKNIKLYNEFCNSTGLRNVNDMDYIFNTIFLLSENGVNTSPLMNIEDPIEIYKNAVKNYLIQGKNCGFCGVGSGKGRKDSNQSYGEEIRNEYIRQAGLQLGINKSSLGN